VQSIDVGDDRKALQAALNTVAQACPNTAVMLAGPDRANNTIALMAVVPQALIAKGLNAGEWVRAAAAVLNGKGGGKPDAAQGGGTDVGKLRECLATAEQFAEQKLGV
jgi:alanyl-tRNA synthetase